MPPSYGDLDNAAVQKDLANRILMQLYRRAIFPRAAATDYDGNPGFQKLQTISISRPRIVEAQDFDPRGGVDATSEEPGYVIVNLTLERLFTQGFPIFVHDAPMNIARYRRDYLESLEGSLRRAFDDYLYSRCFRDYSAIPDTGVARVGATSPIQIVTTAYTPGTDTFAEYDATAQIRTNTRLSENDVPVTDRFMILSHRAYAGFLGDQLMVGGFAASTAPRTPGGDIIERPGDRFIERFDFLTNRSSAIQSQLGLPGTTFDTNVWDTTTFLLDDTFTDTPLEVLQMTASTPGPNFGNFTKGSIVRFTLNSREVFGVVLRVEGGDTIYIKPYYSDGTALPLNTPVVSAAATLPSIPSVNVGYHREHLIYATRLKASPSPGSGATVANARSPYMPVVLQIFSGSYNVDRFRESNRLSLLCGAVPTDWRKSVLVLSA